MWESRKAERGNEIKTSGATKYAKHGSYREGLANSKHIEYLGLTLHKI